MASQGSDRSAPKYDRDLLLSPAKRNELIELWEVESNGAQGGRVGVRLD